MQIETIQKLVEKRNVVWAEIAEWRIIHIVVGCNGVKVYIISVYEPEEAKFEENFKIRRTK